MAFCNTEYFDQIGSIQRSMHERERRRHELEEELFAYLRSDERLTKLKSAKMRCYYKELHEREQQAKTRNLELLGNVESLASKLKEFSIDCSRLLQKRLEYKNHITRLKNERKKMESRGEADAGEHASWFLLSSTRGSSSQSDVIFMSHQSSNGSSRENGITTVSQTVSQTELIPNHSLLTLQQSGILIHPRVSKADSMTVLSNDIFNSADFLEGRLASHVHEKKMASDWDISQRTGEQNTWEKLNSPHTTLKKAEVSSQSVTMEKPATVVSLAWYPTHSPSPDATDPRESSQYTNSGCDVKEVFAKHKGDSALIHDELPDHPQNSIPNSSVEIKSEISPSNKDISVLPSPFYYECHSWKDVIQGQSVIPLQTSSGKQEHADTQQSGRPASLDSSSRVSVKGFCHLLDSIEKRLGTNDRRLYSSCVVSEQKLKDVVSTCSQCGCLDGVELQVCGAVVLQQLPLLSCSLSQGCLLSSDLINTYWSTATKPNQIRANLSADSALLWDRCFNHILKLQQLQIFSTDHIIQLFIPLLVLSNASYSDKAGELLKRLLTESETCDPSESEQSSSCSLPPLLGDSVEIEYSRPSKNSSQTTIRQGIQSAEEDSADQSPVESIPIRETKAYQLLKQSVVQGRRWSNSEEEQSEQSEMINIKNINRLEKPGMFHDSSAQNSQRSEKPKAQPSSAVQSKAFWGESDDSNSEVEMALRPHSRNTSSNDFDDF